MTKEEQLKIYSAYLPYGVELYHDSHFKENRIIKEWGLKKCSDYPISEYCDGTRYGRTFQEVKPILYDISYLTKEIEHEGNQITPIIEIIKQASLLDLNGCAFDIYDDEEEDNGIYINAEDEHGRVIDSLFYDGNIFQKMHVYGFDPVNPQRELQEMLLRYHLNVFDLPEDQFINKATLTQKQ